MTRVLVVGGAGVFGERLAEGLAAAGFSVTVAGRSLDRAEAAAARLSARHPSVDVRATAIDTAAATSEILCGTGATIVVDAAGPFQSAEPRLALAAIAAGLDYLDLADARDFVGRFPALDEAARRAGAIAVTGMSSTPALSHAALDRLTAGWRRIDRVEVGISPGNRAPRGLSAVAAIFGWAGRPVRVFDGGAWIMRPGWSGGVTRRIGTLGPRRLALAETPDLDLLVQCYAPRDAALFRAGLELRVLHDGLALLSLLPRLGLVRSLAPFAAPLRRLADALRPFGTDRGGMLVEAWGRDAEDRVVLALWSLVAEAGDGPYVPTLPALALIRKLVRDRAAIPPGARSGAGLLALDEIEAEFAPHRIATGTEAMHPLSPFEAALGPDFERLPEPVKAAHRGGPVTVLAGTAEVEGADTSLGAVLARIVGFPRAGARVPVRVVMRLGTGGTETWERDFGGRRFRSRLAPGGEGRVRERFGQLTFDLALAATEGGLSMEVAGWRFGPLPLPRFLAPRSRAVESVGSDGRFAFDVPIALPLFGRLVRYRGTLAAASSDAPDRARPLAQERGGGVGSPPLEGRGIR